MDSIINVSPLWSWGGGLLAGFKSFFHQITSWDFSLLKRVLIALPFLFILYVVYLFVYWKLKLVDNGRFWQWYWLRLITWEFGASKTKNTFQSAFLWKKENPDWILISNLKYDFVDFYFDSKQDFDFILKDLVQYIRDTNDFKELHKDFDFPPIKIIVDEAHLYLFARDFKAFTKDLLLVLTQCRKREISIDFITQELWQIDVFIRRLCPYIEYFEKLPFGMTRMSILYNLNADCTSMRDETAFEEMESIMLLPNSRVPIFKPSIKWYYEQEFLTKYVIWWVNVYSSTEPEDSVTSYQYEDFKKKLSQCVINYRKPLPPRKTIFDSLFHKEDTELQNKIIEEQKNKINELIKLIPQEELDKIWFIPDNSQWSDSETVKELPGDLTENM